MRSRFRLIGMTEKKRQGNSDSLASFAFVSL